MVTLRLKGLWVLIKEDVLSLSHFFRTNTGADLLAEGLAFVGFDGKRQATASTYLNVKR
jgi:hypothetical protein